MTFSLKNSFIFSLTKNNVIRICMWQKMNDSSPVNCRTWQFWKSINADLMVNLQKKIQ